MNKLRFTDLFSYSSVMLHPLSVSRIRRLLFGDDVRYLEGVNYKISQFYYLSMRVLGIDPGSETLGWGVVEGSGLKYNLIDFGTVKSSPKDAFSKRLLKISDGIEAVIRQFQPDVLSVEEAFYANNVKVALKLGQVRGVILLTGEKANLEISEFSPRLIKQTVAGYGNAEKHQVQEMVRVLLKMKTVPQPHDAADALAIAICHFHHAGVQSRINLAKLKN